MRCCSLIFMLLCVAQLAMATTKKTSLKKAMFLHTINATAIANGGIGDESLHLDLVNNTDTEYTVTIDPALIFIPEDSAYQHQVIQGDEVVVLPPCSTKSLNLSAFCGKSYAWCPRKNLKYNFWRQGDTNMIKVMRYARQNKVSREALQHAVWTFTNGHALSTVYDRVDPAGSEAFVRFIASVKKCPVPSFYMSYKTESKPGRVMASPDPKVYLTFHWGHEGYRQMYLDIFKENGELYRRVEADRIIDKDGNTVQLELDPRRDPRGKYTVKLHDNSNKTWEEKTVMVGIDPHEVPGRQ